MPLKNQQARSWETPLHPAAHFAIYNNVFYGAQMCVVVRICRALHTTRPLIYDEKNR